MAPTPPTVRPVADVATTAEARAADAAIRRAMADSANWPSYGRDYTNRRYSPLTQITPATIGNLKLAWVYHTGITTAFEGSPIVVDGTMFLSTPMNHVVALDAASGRKKWEYVHQYRTTADCCGPVNRGVAVYGGRVFMGTRGRAAGGARRERRGAWRGTSRSATTSRAITSPGRRSPFAAR